MSSTIPEALAHARATAPRFDDDTSDEIGAAMVAAARAGESIIRRGA